MCDLEILKRNLQERIDVNKFIFNVKAERFEYRKNDILILTNKGKIFTDKIILANYMQAIDGLHDLYSNYSYEYTEIVKLRLEIIRVGISFMDGPYVNLLSYSFKSDLYSLYSVIHSRLPFGEMEQGISNQDKILSHGRKFLPIIEKAQVVKSIFGQRALVKSRQITDGRVSEIVAYNKKLLLLILKN